MDAPGEKLLIKLVEVLQSGVGTATKAWFTKRQARAEALGKAEAVRIERLNQELLRQQLRDIRAGRKTIDSDLKLLESKSEGGNPGAEIAKLKSDYLEALRASGASPAALIELERRINLNQISTMVVDEATAEDEPGVGDDRPIDPDWFAQWRNRAQDVSNEDMQRLWARLLKEEGKKAASFSIHTMDFLSRMSRDDAELIAKVGSFALDDGHLFSGKSPAMEAAGLDLTRLIYLSDLGIITGDFGIGGLNWSANYRNDPSAGRFAIMRVKKKALMFKAKNAADANISVPGYPISLVGRQLLTLAQCEADLDYMKDVADGVRGKCESISICDVVLGKTQGQYQAKIIGPI
jgi:hypothetical protein